MNKIKELLNRIKENFKKNKIITVALIFFWIVVVCLTLFSYKDSLGKISTGIEAYDNVFELVDNKVVEEIVDVVEGSDALTIKMATYARRNTGKFHVTVTGVNSKNIYTDKDYSNATLQDNAFIVVPLNQKLDPKKDRQISIKVFSDCKSDNASGIYYSNLKFYENSKLTIDGKVQEGDMSVRFMSENADLDLFYHIIIIWVISTFTIIILLLLLVKPKYETLFTVIALCFGLTFWLIITPMSVPDETIHYEYAFQMSNKMMGVKNHLVFDEEYQNYGAMAGHLNISAAYERFITKINKSLKLRDNNVLMKFDVDNSYQSSFVIPALGITLARLLKWNMLRTFYLGRLFNLIFYVFCVHLAIKKTPVHKVLFGILATLPIFMQQAASFSYDCYINGLTFVIIAFLMKWLHEDKEVELKDFIIAFIANLLISPIKVVYSLFTLLYWFIPADRFGNKKRKIIALLILTFPAMYELVVLLYPLAYRVIKKIFKNIFVAIVPVRRIFAETTGSPAISFLEGDTYSFADILENPFEMLMLFLRTVRYGLKTWFYGSFGRALSGNTLILPTWIVHSLLAVLVFSSIIEEKTKESIGFKVVTILLCIFGGLMMVGGMLISWTEIDQEVIEDFGGPIIQGIQGRYFSPFLPYLFIILHNNKLKLNKKFEPYLIYTFVLLVFEVIVYVLSYTFMN